MASLKVHLRNGICKNRFRPGSHGKRWQYQSVSVFLDKMVSLQVCVNKYGVYIFVPEIDHVNEAFELLDGKEPALGV